MIVITITMVLWYWTPTSRYRCQSGIDKLTLIHLNYYTRSYSHFSRTNFDDILFSFILIRLIQTVSCLTLWSDNHQWTSRKILIKWSNAMGWSPFQQISATLVFLLFQRGKILSFSFMNRHWTVTCRWARLPRRSVSVPSWRHSGWRRTASPLIASPPLSWLTGNLVFQCFQYILQILPHPSQIAVWQKYPVPLLKD